MSTIVDVVGREVLDSRGNPTVEVEVELLSGAHRAGDRPERRQHRRPRGASSCATAASATAARASAPRSST